MQLFERLRRVLQRPKPQEVEMSTSVLDMSMSLDGYIADPNDFLGGDDGEQKPNAKRSC
jgi:hypothetical protein